MKILMLNERDRTHPLAGGVEVHLDELAGRLADRHGIGTTVLCSSYEGALPEETRNGVQYVRFGNRFSYYAKLPGRARSYWRTGEYDLVVENLCKLLFFSQLYLPRAPHLARTALPCRACTGSLGQRPLRQSLQEDPTPWLKTERRHTS